ncbi:hypothetical protein GCK32_001434 [Trichostrongylus colubriformis]|uniref:Uncharacterized protein n=1 Tax=Trichostrongylus colubriformis TaxID=6319 RepID=A0AAN8IV05_TRICO
MILVLLLCLLSELQAYERIQFIIDAKPTYENWPSESDDFLDQLTRDMFGYNVKDFLKLQPNVFSEEKKEGRDMLAKLRATNGFPRLNEASNEVIISFIMLQDKGISSKALVKTRLANLWEELTSEEQKQWKEKFPYAAFTEKLANIRKGTIEIPAA